MKSLAILSGGAAHGLVRRLGPTFEAAHGCTLDGTFSAVGAMRDKLLGGAPADLLILTQAIISALEADGAVAAGSARDLGTVETAVAVRRGDPAPDVSTGAALRDALLAADEIHYPDPRLATAGIHVAGVIDRLGISAEVAHRVRVHPNGATAMKALGASTAQRPIGSTQITEILSEPGVDPVASLPQGYGLSTVYTAAVAAAAREPALAAALRDTLSAPAAAEARRASGFA